LSHEQIDRARPRHSIFIDDYCLTCQEMTIIIDIDKIARLCIDSAGC
jgi:hypothetical protein